LNNATEILKSEGQELQKSLREKNDANIRFENLCKALKDQANEHIAQKKELAEANFALEGKVHSLGVANKTVEKSLGLVTKLSKSQANELDELNKAIQHLNTEVESLSALNKTLSAENAQVRKAKEAVDDENKYLRGDLDKWQIETMAYQSAKSRLEAECKRLSDNLRDERNKAVRKEKDVLSLEDTLFKTNQAKISFESQLNTIKDSWEKSLRELRIQTESNGTLAADLSIANAQLEDATDSNTTFTRTRKALENEIRKLRSEVANLTEAGGDHHQTVETLKSEISSYMINKSGLEVELKNVKKAHRDAEANVSKAIEKVACLECELMEMKVDNERLMNEVAKEKKVQQRLKAEIRSEQTLRRETACELASVCESSKSKIADLEEKIKVLSVTIKSAQDELRRAIIETGDAKAQLNELESEHFLCKHTVAKLTEKAKTWRGKWDEALQRELDYDPEHLRQQLEDRQTELCNLTASIGKKEMELQALLSNEQKNHQNTKLAWNSFHQNEVNKLNELITEVSNHARDVDSRAAEAQNRITEAKATIERLKLAASHSDCVRYDDANNLLIAYKNLFDKYHDIKKHRRGNYAVTYFQSFAPNANGVYEISSRERRMEYGRVVKW
jgi:chromosome segregation ATPase